MVVDWLLWFVERLTDTVFSSLRSWDSFAQAMWAIPRIFFDLSSGYAWPYLLSNLALTLIVYLVARRKEKTSALSFRLFAFPARIYRHPSTWLDVRFNAIEFVLNGLFYVPIYAAIGLLWNKIVSALLIGRLEWEQPHTLSPMGIVLASIGLILLLDLINYLGHVWCHRSLLLWSFHEVHHSAEVLTPAATNRVHPVENLFFVFLHGPVLGLSAVVFQHILPADRQFLMIGGASVVGFVLYSLGGLLKHSHIWLSFGPCLNRVLISPAHHQIHHSVDPRHQDKNFGASFSFWDRLFGTLYEPHEPEVLRVGLDKPTSPKFKTVGDLYVRPFLKAARSLRWVPKRRVPSRFELGKV